MLIQLFGNYFAEIAGIMSKNKMKAVAMKNMPLPVRSIFAIALILQRSLGLPRRPDLRALELLRKRVQANSVLFQIVRV